jgi:4-methylaminobutanoate oxidase (formaldehyde-forming)
VALAYVWDPDGGAVTTDFLKDGDYVINIGGDLVSATLHLRAPYDPDGIRVK